MIWEVDEDLDGCVNWNEFKLMFLRNICDTTGMEPYSMFNVVQFMMYDKDASGSVTGVGSVYAPVYLAACVRMFVQ